MEFVAEYKSSVGSLWNYNRTPALNGFIVRWIALHAEAIELYEKKSISANDPYESWPKDFLKKRERMISALRQRSSAEEIAQFADCLRQHDEKFGHILQRLVSKIKSELTKAFATQKALSGYARTSSWREIR